MGCAADFAVERAVAAALPGAVSLPNVDITPPEAQVDSEPAYWWIVELEYDPKESEWIGGRCAKRGGRLLVALLVEQGIGDQLAGELLDQAVAAVQTAEVPHFQFVRPPTPQHRGRSHDPRVGGGASGQWAMWTLEIPFTSQDPDEED